VEQTIRRCSELAAQGLDRLLAVARRHRVSRLTLGPLSVDLLPDLPDDEIDPLAEKKRLERRIYGSAT
jgi:hypothetical protein